MYEQDVRGGLDLLHPEKGCFIKCQCTFMKWETNLMQTQKDSLKYQV